MSRQVTQDGSMQVRIAIPLHHHLRILAAQKDTTVRALVEEAVKESYDFPVLTNKKKR